MADDFTARKFEWLEQVATDAGLPPSAARFAIVLGSYLNRETGNAWPSVTALADALCMSRQGVQKTIRALCDRGHLNREVGRGRRATNVYTLPENANTSLHKQGNNTNASWHKGPENANTSWHKPTQNANARLHPLPTPVGTNPYKEPIEDRDSISQHFEAFYSHFPRKAAKVAAQKAFARAVKQGADPLAIVAGSMRYAAERDGQDPKFTKHPATWINGGCWEDEPTPPSPTAQMNGQRMSASEFVQRRDEAIEQGDWQ